MSARSTRISGLLKGGLIILAGALMILPAYINHLIFTRLHFDLVVSQSVSLTTFAMGVLIFIVTIGAEAFERKR